MSYRMDEESVAEIGIKICDFNQQAKGLGTQLYNANNLDKGSVI